MLPVPPRRRGAAAHVSPLSEKGQIMQNVSSSSASPSNPQLHRRRRFLGGLGAAGAAAFASGLFGGGPVARAGHEPVARFDGHRVRDGDILNFALNLEYLEAEFYLQAAFGRGLAEEDTTGDGDRGDVTGGRRVEFATPAVRQYAEEIALDEEAHVRLLRAALAEGQRYRGYSRGRSPGPVARPTINLRESFTAAARAAGVVGAGGTFDPFADEDSFLLGAYVFEDVGVTAYRGAASFVRDPGLLSAAAGLLGVEAYHAGTIRTVLFDRGRTNPTLYDAAAKISLLRDAADDVDGDTGDTDQGIVVGEGDDRRANIVPTDENGLVFARTFEQVLQIVYLGGESGGFGFFPDRLNGLIA